MIIFAGVVGSGKSFQGQRLADERSYPWISTGEFLRMVLAGEKRRELLTGKLFKDEEIIELVEKIFGFIDKHQEFILDGFPRTMVQADWLLEQAKKGELKFTAVVHLVASEEVANERLKKRNRTDDHIKAIHERFAAYAKSTMPVIEHLREAGVPIIEIDANRGVDEVFEQINKAVPKS